MNKNGQFDYVPPLVSQNSWDRKENEKEVSDWKRYSSYHLPPFLFATRVLQV